MAVFNGGAAGETVDWRNRPLNGNGDNSHGIYGNGGNDTLLGAWYIPNTLDGGANNDVLRGGYMNDRLMGQTGDDNLYGDVGSDILIGGTGNDLLFGGDDADRLRGNQGNDLYIINMNMIGVDTIADDVDAANGTGAGGGTDVVSIENTPADQLFVYTVGNDLRITTIVDMEDGVQDRGFVIANQLLGGNNVIEYLEDQTTGLLYDLTLIA